MYLLSNDENVDYISSILEVIHCVNQTIETWMKQNKLGFAHNSHFVLVKNLVLGGTQSLLCTHKIMVKALYFEPNCLTTHGMLDN